MPRARFSLTVALLAGAQALAQPGPAIAEDDAGYRAATGLLHRDMPEQAAAEYRAFLREHPRHTLAPNARYGLAVCLTRLDRWQDAAKELEALADAKGFEFAPDALLLRARCAISLQDLPGAAGSLRALLERFPAFEHADAAAALLGETLYLQERPEDARAILGRFAGEWPNSPSRPRTEFLLALIESRAGELLQAAARLEALRTTWPKSELLPQAALTEAQCRHRLAVAAPANLDREQADRALRLYSLAAKSGPEAVNPDALLGAAQLTRAIGKPDDAGRMLDDLLGRFADRPVAAAARLERARVFLDQDQPRRALDLLDAGGDDGPLAAESAYWAAKSELRLERFGAAADRLAAALSRSPDNRLAPDMLYDQAWALGRAGQAPQARAAFARFRAGFPSHELVPEALAAEVSLAIAAQEYDDAIRLARQFLVDYPRQARAGSVRALLADAEMAAGHADRAVIEYSSFLKAHPDDPRARSAALRYGLALAKLGRSEEAAAALSRAMEAKGDAEPGLIQAASMVLADSSLAAGDWPGAEQRLRAITRAPEGRTPAALLKLAIAIERAGRGDEALAVFDELTDGAGIEAIQAAFERGQIRAGQGRIDEAQAAFDQVIAREAKAAAPRFTVHALRHLASIASQRGNSERAAELLGRVAQAADAGAAGADALYDQAGALMSAGKYEQAEGVLTRFLRSSPDHARGADARAQLAIAASRGGRYEDALSLIQAAESSAGATTPSVRAAMRYELAWALNSLHRGAEAKRAYAALLAERPGPTLEAHAALDLAQLTIADNDYAGAVPYLTRAQSAAGSLGGQEGAGIADRAMYLRGLCLLRTDHPADAAAALDECLQGHDRGELSIAAGLLAGQAYLRDHRPELAVQRLTRVIEASPPAQSLGPALLCLGEALSASQRWETSRAAFERYLREFASSDLWFQAQFGIGWALENQGSHAEAISAYREVVNRHKGPTAARAQFQIGECLFAQKRHDEAVRELLKVDILYAYPEWSAAALYEAGRCLTQLDKPDEARRQFQQVTDRFKDTEWASLAARQLKDNPAAPVPGSH